MTRSSKKGPYVDPRVAKKVKAMADSGQKKVIKTWSRACTIAPDFVGHTFAVHNGKEFLSVFCSEAMVGHKLGEFSPTRRFRAHGGSK
ncbi:30S ribosomal protein S19 [Candidatus Gracilibacteria bacterium]|nr:30S ribosomal protein S19 [Candidatus Gracilibacteria bacterium]